MYKLLLLNPRWDFRALRSAGGRGLRLSGLLGPPPRALMSTRSCRVVSTAPAPHHPEPQGPPGPRPRGPFPLPRQVQPRSRAVGMIVTSEKRSGSWDPNSSSPTYTLSISCSFSASPFLYCPVCQQGLFFLFRLVFLVLVSPVSSFPPAFCLPL